MKPPNKAAEQCQSLIASVKGVIDGWGLSEMHLRRVNNAAEAPISVDLEYQFYTCDTVVSINEKEIGTDIIPIIEELITSISPDFALLVTLHNNLDENGKDDRLAPSADERMESYVKALKALSLAFSGHEGQILHSCATRAEVRIPLYPDQPALEYLWEWIKEN